MILSDKSILEEKEKGNIIITPFDEFCLGSNSYDLHLGAYLGFYTDEIIDAKEDNLTEYIEIPESGFVIEPDKFYLGSTLEYTETHNLVPYLDGKSSTGRLGLSVHETAGKGDAGFKGHWTLEIRAGHKVRIYAKMPIAQIYYLPLDGEVNNPYDKKKDAKYAGQGSLPVPSKMFKNFGKDPFWR